jgi:phospholipid/cholesterol/gamma-HCH transport system substrate-binding protein
METKSNYVMVGAITLLLLALLAAFAIWLSRTGEGIKKEYDIFFQQSVNGLAKGSGVSFSGVPVGEIDAIELWEPDPDFVRVRIKVKTEVPILLGTTATINGIGFTGVSEIQLDGAVKGAPPLRCPRDNPRSACPTGVPVIPTRPGALGELLNNAPLLLERLSTLTERLTNILSDKNEASIEQILDNFESISGTVAQQAPALRNAIEQTRVTLQKAGDAADGVAALSKSTSQLLDSEGRPMMAELRKTLNSANGSLAALETTLNNANPAIETLNTQTLPEVTQLARDLRDLSVSLKSVTERVDQNGLSGVVSAPALPDYKPDGRKRN